LFYRRELREAENAERITQILDLEKQKTKTQFLGVLGFSEFSAVKQSERTLEFRQAAKQKPPWIQIQGGFYSARERKAVSSL
jgi:hypothetical protein